jgi:cysteine desulfuration protein SufE
MTNYSKIAQEIVAEFSFYDDWMDKYEHLISMGKELPPLAAQEKSDDFLVKGCQSRVWLHTSVQNNTVVFRADADALIAKGIIALLIRVFSGQPAEDIVKAETHFIDEIGLTEHLSPNRGNGLMAMIRAIKSSAAQSITVKPLNSHGRKV